MSICKLEHIEKKYYNGETIQPLKDINIEINEHDFVVIEGPSGMGKSTLLYVIGTLLKSDSGSLTIDGVDTGSMSDVELTDLRAEKIGFLFQDSNMIQALTLRENLEFAENIGKAGEGKSKEVGKSRVDELLEKFGLADRANYLPHQLSGGQRRRAMAVRALINSPRLILADEPTNDLDDKWAGTVIDMLKKECEKGSAVVMVTHNDKWTRGATVKYLLADGTLVKTN